MRTRALFFGILPVLGMGCQVEESEPAGEVKYTTFDLGDETLVQRNDVFLVEEMEEPKWRVLYGFADNDRCGGEVSDKHVDQIEKMITKTLQIWIEPLRKKIEEGDYGKVAQEKLVAEFVFEEAETVKLADPPEHLADKNLREFVPSATDDERTKLGIVFYCETGVAMTWIPRLFSSEENSPIILNIYKKWEQLQNPTYNDNATEKNEDEDEERIAITDLQVYQLAMLVHQMGHAFGLQDHKAAKTKEVQQLSVMDVDRLDDINVNTEDYELPLDDADAVKWIYTYRWRWRDREEKSQYAEECSRNYGYDEEDKKCVPRHPLIFAVKQGDLEILKKFMQDNPDADIDERDFQRNTALHHAAEHARTANDRQMYDYLLSQNADTTIKNRASQLASDVIGGEELRYQNPMAVCILTPPRYSADASAEKKLLKKLTTCSVVNRHDQSNTPVPRTFAVFVLMLLPVFLLTL